MADSMAMILIDSAVAESLRPLSLNAEQQPVHVQLSSVKSAHDSFVLSDPQVPLLHRDAHAALMITLKTRQGTCWPPGVSGGEDGGGGEGGGGEGGGGEGGGGDGASSATTSMATSPILTSLPSSCAISP